MDAPEPEQSPFMAVTAHTSKLTRVRTGMVVAVMDVSRAVLTEQTYQAYLDASTPFTTYRWIGTAVLLLIFFLRIILKEGWYIGTSTSIASPGEH